MDLLTLNQFAVLLWKNFTLKRRQFLNLVLEVLTALAFPVMLLLLRAVFHITVAGPFSFTSQPISTLPSFLQNDETWELIYVPSNIDVVKEITENVKRNLNISIKGFSSEIEFEKYIKYDYRSHKVLAAIVFDCDFKNRHDPLPLQVKYRLRFAAIQRTIIWPDETGWKTTLLFPNKPSVGPRNPGHHDGGGPGYIREGFLAIQHALDKAIILYHESSARQLFDNISIFVQRFPYPAYPDDGLLFPTGSFLPLMFILMFSPTVLSIIRSIVWEKEKRLKEYQLTVGLRSWMIWAAYFFTFFFFYIFIIFKDPVFCYSDYSFIFVFLMCYAVASIFFGFMVSTFFKKGDIWTPASLEDKLTFGYMMGMLVIDAFLYGLVTWYIEAVFPGQYGMPQPWYFFLMHSYWFSKPRIKIKKEEMNDSVITQDKYFEAEPTGLVAGIKIKHLYKVLRSVGNKDQWYFGQITILLGQNGAGKTTALSILTGRYPPTRGEVFIDGYDITKNITEIRENLGFCPQGDLLFNDLTLSEHLFFYSMVKSMHQKMSADEINHMLSTFDLLEKRDTFSKSLSGGIKRKLSIIIALLGGSKVVILDEPSSGMDPVSRRATWDILQQFKHDRTILLTTHYMDEADILGDRIAIMVKGTLQCCGSSIFLKKSYGAGYHIVMEREPHFDLEKIYAIIQSYIPDAVLESYFGAELSFILPKEHAHRFEALFNDLEMKKEELGIANFGASISTMEEVFLKVNKLADSETEIQSIQYPLSMNQRRQNRDQSRRMFRNYERPIIPRLNEIANIKFNTGFPLYCQQFHSMFLKRALFNWRSWKLTLLHISIILFVTTYLLTTLNLYYIMPAREMDLSQYGRTIVPYSISGNSVLALNLIKNLEIFLKLKNQELREVQGITDGAEFLRFEVSVESKEYRDFSLTAFSIEVEKNNTVFTIFFNNEAYHSAATSLAVFDNVLFMSLSGPNASIKVSNKPQPLPRYDSKIVPTSGSQIVVCLAFGLAVVIGSFCLQTVTERASNAKQIQFVSGVYLLTYWLSALLWDLIYFSITCCFLLVSGVFIYCGMDAFFANFHFLDTMMIFMLYGWSVVPLMYLGSLLFSSSTAAYIKLTLFNYFSTVFNGGISDFTRTLMNNVLMVLPSYNFAMSISKFFDDYEVKKLCAKQFQNIFVDCSDSCEYMHFPQVLKNLSRFPHSSLVVKAVRNISLLVPKYECFGLLGLNGAGKTTTFKMLTGEEITTSGVVLIDGINITENIRKIRSRIGYCPQSDPMLSHMTGREVLIMYARLRGVPEPDISMYVETFLLSMHLETHADKLVCTYSGGNKRKLNTVIALMGKSSVVFLDEPSTGMDPVARRHMWDTVTWICNTGKAIVISSHSMEECEALCTRLAIMVKGKFKCLGSPHHLKNKFGNIYTLTAKINTDDNKDKLEKFKEFIETNFPGNVDRAYLERRRQWQSTPVLLPGKSHGWRSLVDTTEQLHFHFSLLCIGEGNGNPLQYSCLENPVDRGAWWAAVHRVTQSQTRLKQLSSSIYI
uniref:ABC transporter domain-containing protein n=1 Tax=Moschus moschiferus TaxID=68415 RepID=A0A8C6FY67_MOSMO